MKRWYFFGIIALTVSFAFAEALKTEITAIQKPVVSPLDPGFTRPPILSEGPEKLLGLGLKDAFARFGIPDSLLAVRGPEPWQDDVVFRYDEGYEFYWFKDRIWQIRLGVKYSGPVAGIYPGDPSDKLLSLLGTPEFTAPDFLLFRLPDQGYPLRLRAVISGSKVAELYVFRGDF